MSLLRNDGFLPQMKPLSMKRSTVVSILDVGTSKVCCAIAKLRPRNESFVLPGRTHDIEILGIGLQKGRGIKAGVVIDLDAAEHSIRLAVDAAERMAGVTVESLIVNVSSGRLVSEAFSAEIALGGHPVKNADISQVLRAGAEHSLQSERSVVHSIPIGYSLDGEHGIQDPLNLLGDTLGVDMHIVTAENPPLRNLELCINRAHLSVEAMVATPYASGLAALVEDEAEMGVACIDMGAGTTTLSVFMGKRFVYSDAIAIGGHHVTTDIARGLSTRLDEAEKLKVLHGSALAGSNDTEAMISVPQIGDEQLENTHQVPRSQLIRIIRPRVEEILELVRDRLNRSGFADAVGKRLVLTGGGSQLNGLGEVARRILTRNVRLGRPMGIKGMPTSAKGAAFSTAIGLLIYPQMAQIEYFKTGQSRLSASGNTFDRSSEYTGTGGPFAKFGNWLRESF
ncbi:MAG: cell division protein FtsA [Hyphomicrobiales bacterium]|nr:cell division protein FtsA [Hyphomicrobiales bacterium]